MLSYVQYSRCQQSANSLHEVVASTWNFEAKYTGRNHYNLYQALVYLHTNTVVVVVGIQGT